MLFTLQSWMILVILGLQSIASGLLWIGVRIQALKVPSELSQSVLVVFQKFHLGWAFVHFIWAFIGPFLPPIRSLSSYLIHFPYHCAIGYGFFYYMYIRACCKRPCPPLLESTTPHTLHLLTQWLPSQISRSKSSMACHLLLCPYYFAH